MSGNFQQELGDASSRAAGGQSRRTRGTSHEPPILCSNKKAAQLAAFEYQLRFDQTATIALLFRRYVIAPMPKKPRIIIAQVEGSGTGLAIAKLPKLSERIVSLTTNVNVAAG